MGRIEKTGEELELIRMLKEEVVIRLTYTEDGSDRRPREDH